MQFAAAIKIRFLWSDKIGNWKGVSDGMPLSVALQRFFVYNYKIVCIPESDGQANTKREVLAENTAAGTCHKMSRE